MVPTRIASEMTGRHELLSCDRVWVTPPPAREPHLGVVLCGRTTIPLTPYPSRSALSRCTCGAARTCARECGQRAGSDIQLRRHLGSLTGLLRRSVRRYGELLRDGAGTYGY